MNKAAQLTKMDIKRYLKHYKAFEDKGHNDTHINNVRAQALALARRVKYPEEHLVDAAALLHDVTTDTDRATHATEGAKHVLTDKILRKRFTAEELYEISEAIRTHRASSTERPTSTLGKILRDADRLDSHIGRSYDYGKIHKAALSDDDQVLEAGSHMLRKYGPDGYGRNALEFPETETLIDQNMAPYFKAYKDKDLPKLRELIAAR